MNIEWNQIASIYLNKIETMQYGRFLYICVCVCVCVSVCERGLELFNCEIKVYHTCGLVNYWTYITHEHTACTFGASEGNNYWYTLWVCVYDKKQPKVFILSPCE